MCYKHILLLEVTMHYFVFVKTLRREVYSNSVVCKMNLLKERT